MLIPMSTKIPSAKNSSTNKATARPAPFLPALEGLRAIACSGIIITHVAFQTGADTGNLLNRMMARTDFFVPVFFALSGFLLWRRHRADFAVSTAHDNLLTLAGYYVKRLGRIFPAYLVTVAIVLLFFPVAGAPTVWQMLSNVIMVQIYVDGGLIGGLTHLWSLCVEMAFYLVLPVIAVAWGRQERKWRIVCIVAVAAASFGWAFIPAFAEPPAPGGLNPHIMPPAFIAWFGVGLLGAELESIVQDRAYARTGKDGAEGIDARYQLPEVRVIAKFRWVFWLLAIGALAVAASDGPEGLTHAAPAEFARRTLYGLVFAAALIIPYTLAPRSKFLESAPMQALGRWSYAIFLWHMSLLSLVFPLLGVHLFSGYTALVLVATFVLSVPVAALSYALVEEPARRAINSWWRSVRASTKAEARTEATTANSTTASAPFTTNPPA